VKPEFLEQSAMRRCRLVVLVLILAVSLTGLAGAAVEDQGDVGPLVRALWLVQRHGRPEVLDPGHDQWLKATLAKALGKGSVLTAGGAAGLLDESTFARLAGPDAVLDPKEVRMALDAGVPASRDRLVPRVAAHADYLTTTFDQIDEAHRAAGDLLLDWIITNYRPGQPLHATFICTGNSRRSILGATMGNIAAAYSGLPEIRFHSGGTAPTAFNRRTIACLKAIGVAVEPTGAEAARGEPQTPNPIERIRWGRPEQTGAGERLVELESIEFSKHYSDPSNPQHGFAALLVCSEADAACPVVKGASVRIAMPYLDPKIYDDGAYEAAKYAERRDDIGRLLLSVLLRARNRLDRSGTRD
jgi:hypothetical protein